MSKLTVTRLRSREVEISEEESKLNEWDRELLIEKNIIVIDIEKIRLNVKLTKTLDAAVCVVVIELNREVLVNNTIRYPVNCITNMCTDFYGIDLDMITNESSFNFTQRKVPELCRKTNIFNMVSSKVDFDFLRNCCDDYNNLLFKNIDIGRLLSPRKNDSPFL